jgi:xanthine/uracil/vitamin C permease (AzgA family)
MAQHRFRIVEPRFQLRERGTSVLREVRGGVATFFALAYIVVLNPLILGSGKDVYGHTLSTAQLTVATAVVAGVLLLVMAFITPLTGIVPQQAAAPALVVVGFLMLTQIRDIPWDDWSIAIPSYLAIALMPFTYSITDGIGAAVIAFVAIRLALGRLRELHPLMIVVALLFAAYFAISPIEESLGVR